MSGGGVGQGAVYSPLPQSISDIDSSEEELNSIIHHNDSRKFIVSCKNSLEKHNGKNMGEYRPLGHEGEGEVSINGLPSRDLTTADDVPIIKTEGSLPYHLQPMSPLRKVCFIFSILLCALTIVVFLWLLPCDLATCPSAPLRLATKSWEKTLQSVELKGRIQVVAGVPGRGRNLVFLARGDVINAALNSTHNDKSLGDFSANGGGLVSLIGSTGKVAWYIHFVRIPLDMDCSLIDVTGDGAEDCIVVGTGKLLTAVNPISGSIEWYLHNHNDNRSAVDLEFPIVLPDLDGDGIRDMVTVCSFNDTSSELPVVSQRNKLIIISGKMGRIIGQAVDMPKCERIHGLNMEKDWNISYICNKSKQGESIRIISIQELYTIATNRKLNSTTFLKSTPLKQHHSLGRINKLNRQISLKVSGRQLILENQGHCPNHCNVTVQVKGEQHNSDIIWNFTQENAHGMVPVVLVFNNHTATANTGTLIGPVSGFVLKFWTWSTSNSHIYPTMMKGNDSSSITSSNPLFRIRLKKSINTEQAENTIDDDDDNDDEETSIKKSRFYRSVIPTLKQNSKDLNYGQIDLHQLKERVVLFTFNATDNHIVNASLNDILQLCSHHGQVEDQVCQPNLTFQEESLLIADLDQDGSQELISYLTTYVTHSPEGSTTPLESTRWYLQSRVRVVRLEAELPKLYEAVARQ